MSNSSVVIAAFLMGCIAAAHAQDASTDTSNAATPQAQPQEIESAAPAVHGLIDLDEMTFDCPKAGLNAAAREAARAPSQGTYQFSFFKIVHDAHHAFYEVHFKSNYQGEPELKYCVSMYCQQGWDPTKTKTEVTLMSNEQRRGASADASECGKHLGHEKKKRRR
jgi:hypothetical protein